MSIMGCPEGKINLAAIYKKKKHFICLEFIAQYFKV